MGKQVGWYEKGLLRKHQISLPSRHTKAKNQKPKQQHHLIIYACVCKCVYFFILFPRFHPSILALPIHTTHLFFSPFVFFLLLFLPAPPLHPHFPSPL